MDLDDDMFELSDEELPIPTPKCNPIEAHLMKTLSNVQTRIEKTTNDIKEVQDMTKRISESLYNQALYGKDISSDSDSDLYAINGQPVVKKKKCKVKKFHYEILVIKSSWKYIFNDKWVIGIELMNNSNKKIRNPQVYMSLAEDDDLCGMSMIWNLENETFGYPINEIRPSSKVVATVVLDLPKFDKKHFCEVYGTIAYEVEETEYQVPVPIIRLTIEDTIDDSYQVKFLTAGNHVSPIGTNDIVPMILALRSTSVEKNINAQIKGVPERNKEFLKFLKEKSFQEIYTNTYIVQTTGCLMHCLIEILPNTKTQEKLRISARSSHQMNIILRLVKEYFPDIVIEEDVNPIRAAMALMEELKLYLQDTSTATRQMARIKTDLLIP
ncbi:uncharacterized protein LOC117232707 [Bombus vosnesenskii]|uniref:Uncharacterized protein LOC117232707 n=2 Tax=Pyrobombus TaxID=144703 RepID=A0A6J3K4Z0_9HYME|nr:uncharacterized protein LOC117232707 [Bombus vosnesenskii]XP_033348163.1 uncharacterized protein LOC117232707 [Bombus vosnesenskii]XP_050491607.1 uncharacterized protein LOC126874048 isoform X1 [Bombus huntii]